MSFGNLSSLTYLDLENNQFNRTLPQNFGQRSKFETLYIDSNMLKGVVSEVHFSNLTSLRILYASRNQLTLKASQNWIPPFQLESLFLIMEFRAKISPVALFTKAFVVVRHF